MKKRLDVLICGGAACIASHSHEIKSKLIEKINEKDLTNETNIVETRCTVPCELGEFDSGRRSKINKNKRYA